MYSTTPDGGTFSGGVIFSLQKTAKGWKQTVIHNINFPSEGGFPYEGLMRDTVGNLYGAAPSGGVGGQGVIYRLSPTRKAGCTPCSTASPARTATGPGCTGLI